MPIDVETTYRKYGPMVRRRCRGLLPTDEEALDAMHDTFVQLLRHRRRLEDAYPSSLLHTMATNVCLNRIRARTRRPEDSDTAALERIVDAAPTDDGRVDARSGLARLFGQCPASTATIAVLHFHDGLTLAEVAEHVGLSVSGVRKRLRGLRARLEAES